MSCAEMKQQLSFLSLTNRATHLCNMQRRGWLPHAFPV